MTVYAPTDRLMTTGWQWKTEQEIKMTCSQKNDAFTVSDTSKGNGALTYPVSLITADELLAGGSYAGSINSNYYLYTGSYYFTISPLRFDSEIAGIFRFESDILMNHSVHSYFGVRPVISLKPSVELTGTGTMSNPYQLSQ